MQEAMDTNALQAEWEPLDVADDSDDSDDDDLQLSSETVAQCLAFLDQLGDDDESEPPKRVYTLLSQSAAAAIDSVKLAHMLEKKASDGFCAYISHNFVLESAYELWPVEPGVIRQDTDMAAHMYRKLVYFTPPDRDDPTCPLYVATPRNMGKHVKHGRAFYLSCDVTKRDLLLQWYKFEQEMGRAWKLNRAASR